MFLFPSQRTQSVSLQTPWLPAYDPSVINLSTISLTSVLHIEAVDSSGRLVARRKAACCLKRDGFGSGSQKYGFDCAAWLQDHKWQLMLVFRNEQDGQFDKKQTVLHASQSAIWELRFSGLLRSE